MALHISVCLSDIAERLIYIYYYILYIYNTCIFLRQGQSQSKIGTYKGATKWGFINIWVFRVTKKHYIYLLQYVYKQAKKSDFINIRVKFEQKRKNGMGKK